jgi:hypothetical protein
MWREQLEERLSDICARAKAPICIVSSAVSITDVEKETHTVDRGIFAFDKSTQVFEVPGNEFATHERDCITSTLATFLRKTRRLCTAKADLVYKTLLNVADGTRVLQAGRRRQIQREAVGGDPKELGVQEEWKARDVWLSKKSR